jgi:hypothetical protein
MPYESNIRLGKRNDQTSHPLHTWLNDLQIRKAINNGGRVDAGPVVFEIVNDNLARATYEDGGFEEYQFIRKTLAVRAETFAPSMSDSQYKITPFASEEEAITEYLRLKELVGSENLYSVCVVEVWI